LWHDARTFTIDKDPESAAQRCALAAVGRRVDKAREQIPLKPEPSLKNAAHPHRQLHAVLGGIL